MIEGKPVELRSGDAYYIGEGKVHNVINRHDDNLEYVYVVGMLN
jgi:mannose-6-phosphate isomerase-like protein (cupin superfamily)